MSADVQTTAFQHYSDRYEVLAHRRFRSKDKQRMKDHGDEVQRQCRFCNRGRPEATFKSVAHAAPEFLGNKSIVSLNECDDCNTFLADNYEDHLAKWTMFARATSNVDCKGGKPTFKNSDDSLRIESTGSGQNITITDPALFEELRQKKGTFDWTVPVVATSQRFVPLRAAMALIKSACSVCPTSELPQCQPTIDWLMRRHKARYTPLPVLHSFNPGPVGRDVNEIILLRRKVDEPIPYMWVLIQYGHHRLQTFVPFCKADLGWMSKGAPSFDVFHVPSRFDVKWQQQYGNTEERRLDWSSPTLEQATYTLTLQLTRAEVVPQSEPGAE